MLRPPLHEALADLPAAVRRTAASLRTLRSNARPAWKHDELAGRLVELSGARANGSLSLAFALVRDAQERGEHVAWIGARATSFFPPDVAGAGVDLDALAVVRAPRDADIAVAADWIARSGAFGLVVLDLCAKADVPMALQSRLASLAQKHDLAVLCLTEKSSSAASLSSLVSLRGEATLRRRAPHVFECELLVTKDKRRSEVWRHLVARSGVEGLP